MKLEFSKELLDIKDRVSTKIFSFGITEDFIALTAPSSRFIILNEEPYLINEKDFINTKDNYAVVIKPRVSFLFEDIVQLFTSKDRVGKKINEDLRNKKALLYLFIPDFCMELYKDIDKMIKIFEEANVDLNRLYIYDALSEKVNKDDVDITSSARYNQMFKNFEKMIDSKNITYRLWNAFLLNDQTLLDLTENKDMLEFLFKNTETQKRLKYFTSFNSSISNIRVNLFEYLKKENIIEKGIVSFFPSAKREDLAHWTQLQKYIDDEYLIYSDDSFIELQEDFEYATQIPFVLSQFNSYFEVVTETTYNDTGSGVLITEKTWKPILTFKPFINVGNPGILRKLKEWGFKTFEPYIDESYDSEPMKFLHGEDINSRVRCEMAYSNVKKLCNMTHKELHDWYWSLKDILIHNFNHFYKLTEEEIISISGEIEKDLENESP